MKIPKRMNIVGLEWQVDFDAQFCADRSVHGATSSDSQTIKLQPQCSRQLQEQTFIHELLHAVWWSMGLKEHFKDDDEEKVVNSLANGLYQALNENGLLQKR